MGAKPTFRWVTTINLEGEYISFKAPLIYKSLADTTYNERQPRRLQDRSKYNPKDCFKAGKR